MHKFTRGIPVAVFKIAAVSLLS